MAEPTLRDRVAPYLPYWPWVVVPALILALVLQASRISAQAHQLDLMRGDLHAIQQQVQNLKKARNGSAQPSLLSELQQPQPRAATGARTGKARTAGTAPRSRPPGATASKTGKRTRRAPAPGTAPTEAPVAEPTEPTP